MATKQYQWRAATKFNSDTSLSYGVTPSDKSTWQTADIGTGGSQQTFTWWYRDTNTSWSGQWTDDVSTRVAISITESWTTSVDSRNNLTVTVSTIINSVVRDDPGIYGGGQDTPGRSINIYKDPNSSAVLSLTDNQVGTSHTIYGGPLTIDTFSFTIAPGQNLERSTLYVHNQTIGYASFDDIWMGIQFRNPLPADYIPGAIYDNGVWKSHNRNGGTAEIRNGSSYNVMRTIDGAEGSDDPPYIRHSSGWKNQRLIGQDQ